MFRVAVLKAAWPLLSRPTAPQVVPVVFGHGLNDPRVSLDQAEQMARALRERKRQVALIVYPDEAHGFARPENRLKFYAAAEAFLAKHLKGGRAESADKE